MTARAFFLEEGLSEDGLLEGSLSEDDGVNEFFIKIKPPFWQNNEVHGNFRLLSELHAVQK